MPSPSLLLPTKKDSLEEVSSSIKSPFETILLSFTSFPFTKTLHRVPTSPFGFVSFAIPGSKRNTVRFRSSLEKVSRRFFEYSSIHEPRGLSRIVNSGLLKDGEWGLPECLISGEIRGPKEYKPAISSIGCSGYLGELTKDDFITSEIVAYHLRKSSTELAKIMKSRGYDVRANQNEIRCNVPLVMVQWCWAPL